MPAPPAGSVKLRLGQSTAGSAAAAGAKPPSAAGVPLRTAAASAAGDWVAPSAESPPAGLEAAAVATGSVPGRRLPSLLRFSQPCAAAMASATPTVTVTKTITRWRSSRCRAPPGRPGGGVCWRSRGGPPRPGAGVG